MSRTESKISNYGIKQFESDSASLLPGPVRGISNNPLVLNIMTEGVKPKKKKKTS